MYLSSSCDLLGFLASSKTQEIQGRIKGDWSIWAQSGPAFERIVRYHQNERYLEN